MRQAGRSLPEYRETRRRATLAMINGDPALTAEVTLQPVRRLGVDAAILFADITTPLSGLGIASRIVDGVGPVVDRPIRTLADVGALRPFTPEEAVAPMLAAIRLIRRDAEVPLVGFAGAPFTLASYLVGGSGTRSRGVLRQLLRESPEIAERLFEALTRMSISYLRAQVAAGVQALQVFDTWMGALSRDEYQRHVWPHMRRLFDGIADCGVPTIHFARGAADRLDLMASAGGDVIGIDARIGLADAWSQLPGHAIQGNLAPEVVLMPWLVTASHVDAILDQAARRPGHIFNLGHGVLPTSDPDQLARIVDRVHERTADELAA